MKLTILLLIIIIEHFSYSNSYVQTMVEVVQAISQVHHFGYYLFIRSEEESHKLNSENLLKTLHSRLKFFTIIDVCIHEVEEYVEGIKAGAKLRRSNVEMKSLIVFNGHNEFSRKKFADLSKKINFGGKDVWLLVLDGKIELEKYLNVINLRFNSKLILALVQNSTHIQFKAPYRVARNFSLRITEVGFWTETNGLNLPLADVATTRNNLEGFQFRVGTWNHPPFVDVKYEKNGQLRVGGYLADVWKELSERLNFTFIYHLSKDKGPGIIGRNGSWTGLIGMLVRDEIDAAVVGLSRTNERIDFVDFSFPFGSTGGKIFYLDRGNRFGWGNFFRPFCTEVWLALLLSFVVTVISLTFFHAMGVTCNIENYLLKQEYTILGSFLIVLRAFTNQGSDLTPESAPSRIVFFSAYLTMAVTLPSYSAGLISYLTVQAPYKPFDSFETMLNARTHMLLVSHATADYDYFAKSTTPLIHEVFKNLIKPLEMSGRLPSNPKQGIELVCKNEDLAFFANYISATKYAEEFFLKHGCRIISMENIVTDFDECLGFQKDSPYTLAINLELQKMVLSGLLRRFEEQAYTRKKRNYDPEYQPISIRHVIEIPCLLLCCYFFSVIICVAEIFSMQKKKFVTAQKN